jgi:multidrug efflux system membrane fusion protein
MKTAYLLLTLAALSMCTKPAPPPPLLPTVNVSKSVAKDTWIHLDYIGHVEPYISVKVQSQVQGIITGKYYQDGQEVREGDLLFTIDDRPYLAALQKAEAILEQNLATFAHAQERMTRYSSLVDQEYVSILDYDQYVTDTLVDEAIIKQNEADVDEARLNLDYCFIRAPMDSVTGLTTIQVGNFVTVGQEDPLVILNEIDPLLISFYVPETDLPTIQKLNEEGTLTVQVFLDGDPIPKEGPLTLIDNQVDESTGRILLQATIGNTDKTLWPGEYVDTKVLLSLKENAVLIPMQAVQIGQQGPYIFVMLPNHTIEMRPVVLGQKENEKVIVEKGVAANEYVVLEGQLNLSPGVHVNVKDEVP